MRSNKRKRKVPLFSKNDIEIARERPEVTLVAYDENLLERTRTQWQFGDWTSLAKLDRQPLQHHPDRAKLALMAAAGHLQTNSLEEAMRYIRLAKDWGCSNKLIVQILAAGAHNSLGRAAAQAGQQHRAYEHFEQSILLGTPGSDYRLLTQARSNVQFAQLGMSPPESSSMCEIVQSALDLDNATEPIFNNPTPNSPISIEKFFSDQDGDRAESLECLRKEVVGISSLGDLPSVEWVSAQHRGKNFYFAHFSGDYIPGKISEKNQFYEYLFLNLLARLHSHGKIVVDVGANIGNHSVFFAGVMSAQVVSFEPQPYNYFFLMANIFLNNLESKINIRNVAIGEEVGRIKIVQSIKNNYGSFTSDFSKIKFDEKSIVDSSFEVNVSTIDNELSGYRKNISIIKIDIEGMELSALKGAEHVIRESLPVISVECFKKSIFFEIKEYLSEFDYFVIDSANATPSFIFISRKNITHQQFLVKYLEMSSVGKFSSNNIFNEISE